MQKYLVLLACISTFVCYSQESFVDGYIITLENDTIRGTTRDRSSTKNYDFLKFKLNGETVKYFPDQIIGYGYDDKYFSSGIEDGVFVEALVLGELSLYKYRDMFFVKYDGVSFRLQKKDSITTRQGVKRIVEDNKWKGVFLYVINEKSEVERDKLHERLSFNEKSLTKEVIHYNDRNSDNYIVFKDQKAWLKIAFGLGIGYDRTNGDIETNFTFLNRELDHFGPSFSLLFPITFPRQKSRFSIQPEIIFQKIKLSGFNEIDREFRNENANTSINLTSISVPYSFRYLILDTRIKIRAHVGVGMSINLNTSSSEIIRTSSIGVDPIVTGTIINDDLFDFNTVQGNYFAGVSGSTLVGNLNLGLRFRHYLFSNLSKDNRNVTLDIDYNRSSITFFITKN
ncbi:MAG: hypothetical protein AAF363_11445 [Bacteroidota bacterium]